MEIGHGDISQCSVVSNAAIEKILSVCRMHKPCTVEVEIAPKTAKELSVEDNLFITDRDKVLSVHPGAAPPVETAAPPVETCGGDGERKCEPIPEVWHCR
jgi:hypothetical protein